MKRGDPRVRQFVVSLFVCNRLCQGGTQGGMGHKSAPKCQHSPVVFNEIEIMLAWHPRNDHLMTLKLIGLIMQQRA